MRKIRLEWKEFGEEHSKTISYEAISYYMEGLKKGFQTDNEASTKILRVLPKVKRIRIDKDFNEVAVDPFIFYQDIEGHSDIIKIRRRNKLVWFILNDLCS